MVKLIAPSEIKIEVKPLKLVPSDDHYDRMSRMEWRLCVQSARRKVGSALNRFYYGSR